MTNVLSIALALSSATRLLILDALTAGPLTIGVIATQASVAQSTASVHVHVLAEAGLVGMCRRRGLTIVTRRCGPWDELLVGRNGAHLR